MNRRHLAVLLALAASPALAQMYKWTDDKGVVHYSQTKPPQSAAEVVSPKAPPPTASPNQDGLKKFVDGAAKQGAQAQKERAARADELALRKERCDRARSRVAYLTGSRSAYTTFGETKPDGSVVAWDAARLEAETARARRAADEACKG